MTYHAWRKTLDAVQDYVQCSTDPSNVLEVYVYLQDVLFKKNFSALPGLNSPARLIREMVKTDVLDAVVGTEF